jgi:DNA polymerase-4
MPSTILHVAIDSFAIQAERLRCPKLVGRPVALAPSDSPRPRVVAASREARSAGVAPGTPLLVARRLCRDLVALPPDRDLYAGLQDSIRGRLAPFAPFADGEVGPAGAAWGLAHGPSARGRFALDLTGVTRTHAGARDRASAAGREVERVFGLHPTLGLAATRLVSGVAASVLAPDGELLDVPPGSEVAFLAPLEPRVLPTTRERAVAARIDLLNLRVVRDLQALTLEQLSAAFGAAAGVLWREARGLDALPRRAAAPARVAVAEETLSQETNDLRVLGARVARLAMEIGVGLRGRGVVAGRLGVTVAYADGREGSARGTADPPTAAEGALRQRAVALLERAASRRVRVRRIRIEAWEALPVATQLTLWDAPLPTGSADAALNPQVASAARPPMDTALISGSARGQRPEGCIATSAHAPGRDAALERALDRVRGRFGTDALVPAAWMAHGLVLRPPARP